MRREVEEQLREAPADAHITWCVACGRVHMSTRRLVMVAGKSKRKRESVVLNEGSNPECGSTVGTGTPQECLSAFGKD